MEIAQGREGTPFDGSDLAVFLDGAERDTRERKHEGQGAIVLLAELERAARLEQRRELKARRRSAALPPPGPLVIATTIPSPATGLV